MVNLTHTYFFGIMLFMSKHPKKHTQDDVTKPENNISSADSITPENDDLSLNSNQQTSSNEEVSNNQPTTEEDTVNTETADDSSAIDRQKEVTKNPTGFFNAKNMIIILAILFVATLIGLTVFLYTRISDSRLEIVNALQNTNENVDSGVLTISSNLGEIEPIVFLFDDNEQFLSMAISSNYEVMDSGNNLSLNSEEATATINYVHDYINDQHIGFLSVLIENDPNITPEALSVALPVEEMPITSSIISAVLLEGYFFEIDYTAIFGSEDFADIAESVLPSENTQQSIEEFQNAEDSLRKLYDSMVVINTQNTAEGKVYELTFDNEKILEFADSLREIESAELTLADVNDFKDAVINMNPEENLRIYITVNEDDDYVSNIVMQINEQGVEAIAGTNSDNDIEAMQLTFELSEINENVERPDTSLVVPSTVLTAALEQEITPILGLLLQQLGTSLIGDEEVSF